MRRLLFALTLVAIAFVPAAAQDAPPARPLFNGTDLTGWQTAAGQPAMKWVVKDGAMTCEKGGDIWTKDRFGDFVLELEYKTAGNSGVFIRTDNPKDNVQTGIEIQVDKPRAPGKHSVGAVYDLQAPSKNAATDGWNKMVITASGSLLKVHLNGEQIIDMDLDRWTEPGLNPDGSKNKFKTALKNFKREGHIGFQDHNHEVAYRNVKIQLVKK